MEDSWSWRIHPDGEVDFERVSERFEEDGFVILKIENRSVNNGYVVLAKENMTTEEIPDKIVEREPPIWYPEDLEAVDSDEREFSGEAVEHLLEAKKVFPDARLGRELELADLS